MKEDLFKKYVNENRDEFEIHDSDLESLWGNIDREIQKNEGFNWSNALKIAASIVVIAMLGLLVLRFSYEDKYAEGVALHQVSPELAETEYFLYQQVEEKLLLIKASQGDIEPQVLQNLAVLDSAYSDLKKDLSENLGNEEIINAMIENYRIKLMILESILEQLNTDEDNNENRASV